MLGVPTERKQGLGHSSEEQVEQGGGVGSDQRIEYVRQREHQMEVGGVHHLLHLVFSPLVTRLPLAFRAMPVQARIVLIDGLATGGTLPPVTAFGSGAALGDMLDLIVYFQFGV